MGLTTPNLLDVSYNPSNSGTISTGSFAVTGSCLLVLFIANRQSNANRSVSSVSDTLPFTGIWEINRREYSNLYDNVNFAVATCESTDAGSGIVTVTFSGNTARKVIHLFEICNYDTGSPIIQTSASSTAGSALDVTISTPESDSCVVGGIAMSSAFASPYDVAPGANYTELSESSVQNASGNVNLEIEYDSTPTTTIVDWSGLEEIASIGIAIEIGAASGSGGGGGSTITGAVGLSGIGNNLQNSTVINIGSATVSGDLSELANSILQIQSAIEVGVGSEIGTSATNITLDTVLITALSNLIAGATNIDVGSTDFSGTSVLEPSAINIEVDAVEITGTDVLEPNGLNIAIGSALIDALCALIATGTTEEIIIQYGQAILSGRNNLISTALDIVFGQQELTASATLLAQGLLNVLTNSILSGTGNLQANSILLVKAVTALGGAGILIPVATIPSTGVTAITPADRSLVVPADDRIYVIMNDGRVFIIMRDDRTLFLGEDNRIYPVE